MVFKNVYEISLVTFLIVLSKLVVILVILWFCIFYEHSRTYINTMDVILKFDSTWYRMPSFMLKSQARTQNGIFCVVCCHYLHIFCRMMYTNVQGCHANQSMTNTNSCSLSCAKEMNFFHFKTENLWYAFSCRCVRVQTRYSVRLKNVVKIKNTKNKTNSPKKDLTITAISSPFRNLFLFLRCFVEFNIKKVFYNDRLNKQLSIMHIQHVFNIHIPLCVSS